METRPARIGTKGRRGLPLPRWMRRDTSISLLSVDREVEIAILRIPETFDVERVSRLVVFVADDERVPEGRFPSDSIDESTRRVFAKVGEEYAELCDRLFADDPVFSYGTAEGDELL